MFDKGSIVFTWQVSSFFGWGVYGLNLMLHWPFPALTAVPHGEVVVADDNQFRHIERLLAQSRPVQAAMKAAAGEAKLLPVPVFLALGKDFVGPVTEHAVLLSGRPTVGFMFLEDTEINESQAANLAKLAMVVAGARWNAELLAAAGVPNVVTVLQGVDCELFQPRPASGYLADRFKIFSGGKLEYRKGQDLILLAFRSFARRHPDAILVTAGSSPWPVLSKGFAINPATGAPPFASDGSVDFSGWALRLGIPPEQVIDLGPCANSDMPTVLRDMDAAIFPNRCEGGTNLVAMECLASGVPTVLSANTGHLDLIERTGCLSLSRQLPVTRRPPGLGGTEGWGESDVDEIEAALEWIYTHRAEARAQAVQAAAAIAELSWKRQIGTLYETLKPVL